MTDGGGPRRGRRWWRSIPPVVGAATALVLVVGSIHVGSSRAAFVSRTDNGGNSIEVSMAWFYPSLVQTAPAPTRYWRLEEASGTVMNTIGPPNATASATGITRGATGALNVPGEKAYTFDGTAGCLVDSASSTPSAPISLEVWFRVADGYATGGFMLVPVGSSSPAASGGLTGPMLYLRASGQVSAAFYTGNVPAFQAATSPLAYNDGTWHHVVATMDASAGLKLYVDGATTPVATNSATNMMTSPFWWHVGCGPASTSGLPGTTDDYLAATLDEIAIYTRVLSPTEIHDHYVTAIS